jgi:hypothetical protein
MGGRQPKVQANWAQIRLGAATAHLDKRDLGECNRRAATQRATCRVLKLVEPEPEPEHDSAVPPHMTVAYSTTAQPAKPIIDAMGRSVGEHWATIDALSLVIQWGPERLWEWEPVGTIAL